MLYERWRKIAAERSGQPALCDAASGRHWTFGELLVAGETRTIGPAGTAFPQGHSPEFILDLLAAWRENKMVCPLEPGQTPPQIPLPPVDCVHLKCTSATTGAARVIAFTAGQLAADAENIVATMNLRPDWPNLGVISMAHSYGFSNLVLPLLLHGIPLTLAPSPLPEIVRRAMENEAAITLAAVPAMWRAWHEADAIPPNVRLAISAGAPLPLALEQAVFKTRGVKIHNFLGSSECGGIAYNMDATPRTDAALAGSPMRNVKLSLNDDGCLVVRSRAVGETYWPEKLKSLGGGIFQTSDMAELKGGLVFLRGRLSDQINVAGHKLLPETVERALLAHPQVRECLVFGAPSRDAGRTEMVVAVVASDASEMELRQFLLQTLPAWQVPREWRFVKSLAGNTRGKISRAEWRQRYGDKTHI
ncbi:MAG: fatty acid--CoA ligase family protein [Verrucomicrobiota bacterium]|jgi:acyl-coenzyme A synthetase/AMP-(fatty) acid ligase